MGKEVEIRAKENSSYKLILKLELDEEDEELLKKRFNLLALSPRLNNEQAYRDWETDRKSTRLNSSHITRSRMPSSA